MPEVDDSQEQDSSHEKSRTASEVVNAQQIDACIISNPTIGTVSITVRIAEDENLMQVLLRMLCKLEKQ